MPTITCRDGRPYTFAPQSTALLVIDMQRDFCCDNGYAAKAGGGANSVAPMRAIIPNVQRILARARSLNMLIIHTREGHLPDLSDCPPAKLERSKNANAEIGSAGPLGRLLIRGEYGHDFIDELQPLKTETVLDKPGFGAFHATNLSSLLRDKRITHLIVTGVTTEVCVHSTLREAVDRGYDCLTIADATATFDLQLHEAALKMIDSEGGIFGHIATTAAVLESP